MHSCPRTGSISPDPPESITTVGGALCILKWLEEHFFDCDMWPGHTFPFGLWFRGHWQPGLKLEPGAFRGELAIDAALRKDPKTPEIEKGTWDETNVYEHLRLRVPLHQRLYQSAFDWLCLMEHYLLPTRLLDWSESILPALFFATRKRHDIPGELIVLNAKRLNNRSKKHPTISTPTDGHVVIRAEMATTRSLTGLRLKSTVRAALAEEGLLQANGGLPR
ncbi:MAG TPA: FRG domain-containing protein, partial [Thermoanaerobaculia bacterium]|nr:FRG domain-containing protein [Thermoanaerobaculia bacterium]